MENQQEYMIKMQMIQQEGGQLEEKMQVIDQQIADMQSIKSSLGELKDKKKGDEILSNLGKGIFIKAKLEDKDVFVNVGKEVMVKKSLKETEQVLDEQVGKLMIGKQEIMARLEQLQGEMMSMVQEAQAQQMQVKEKDEKIEKSEKKKSER